MSRALRRLLPVAVVLAVLGPLVASAAPPSTGLNAKTQAQAAAGPVVLSITPGPDARDVDPRVPVILTASNGTLRSVAMVNDSGKPVEGVLTPDNTVWKPTVPLGYGRTYTVTAIAIGPDGTTRALVSTFSTLVPGNQTSVRLTTTGDHDFVNGNTYGVGTVIVARFDEPIPDHAAAERVLRVRTDPPTEGAWNWVDDQTAHWRPRHYFTPGTTVAVAADIYSVALGNGLYGQADVATRFRIGDSHIAIANDITKQISVFKNGQLVRTMPTSMGMGGSESIGGHTIHFWTQRGIYTVMGKANPVVMDSSTYGLPINSRLGYKETVNYATRISTDGIYLHQFEDTLWAQGNTNLSHGCLNLSAEHARWFYDFSQPGDIVEVRFTGGPPLELSQNGDWSVPWDQWVKGSAL